MDEILEVRGPDEAVVAAMIVTQTEVDAVGGGGDMEAPLRQFGKDPGCQFQPHETIPWPVVWPGRPCH